MLLGDCISASSDFIWEPFDEKINESNKENIKIKNINISFDFGYLQCVSKILLIILLFE
jgi:hypothetical protein